MFSELDERVCTAHREFSYDLLVSKPELADGLLSHDRHIVGTARPIQGTNWHFLDQVLDSPEFLLLVFFLVWTGIAVLSKILLGRAANAPCKRRTWQVFYVSSSFVLVGFVWASGLPPLAVWLTAGSSAVITLISLRTVWFCDTCGRLAVDRLWQPRPARCPRCGAGRSDQD